MSQRTEPVEEAAASVAVVDYGLGNLRSVTRGLGRAGADVSVTDDPADLADADGVVLPGVGAFREGVENAGPFRDALRSVAASGTPLFGICLGMQMLLTTSEEADHGGQGSAEGLDFVPGENVRFPDGLTVPHMGWNRLDVRRDHPLVEGVDGRYAYFVHSYYAVPDDERATVATTEYGAEPQGDGGDHGAAGRTGVEFPAVVADEAGTVFGTQFHPEKSGETGLKILRNFVDLCADS